MTLHHPYRILWLVSGAVVLLLNAGCEPKHHAGNKPVADLQSMARTDTYTPRNESATVSSSTSTLRGPRSAEDIERAYNTAPAASYSPAPAPRAVAAPAPAFNSNEPVVAEPGWDVPITREWRHIVIHHSAGNTGSAAIFDRAHRERGWDGLGYHFVIGNGSVSGDGQVEIGYRWKNQMQGAHAGNVEYNQAGIGICLVGDFEHGGRPTPQQMVSLRRLVRFLQVRTGIQAYEVIGHGNVPGRNTDCPGKNLDLAAFRESLGVPIQYTRPSTPAPAPSSSSSRLARREPTRTGAALP